MKKMRTMIDLSDNGIIINVLMTNDAHIVIIGSVRRNFQGCIFVNFLKSYPFVEECARGSYNRTTSSMFVVSVSTSAVVPV